MSHPSNKTFNAVITRLCWSMQRGAQTLDVSEDDFLAWQDGRRPVPDRILDILKKYEDIYGGKRLNQENADRQGSRQAYEDEEQHNKKEKLLLLRVAYTELAREYAALAARTPGGLETSFGPYAVLGILPGTPWREIKAQYYSLSKTHHPDRGGDEEIMKDISMAYTKLRLIYGE